MNAAGSSTEPAACPFRGYHVGMVRGLIAVVALAGCSSPSVPPAPLIDAAPPGPDALAPTCIPRVGGAVTHERIAVVEDMPVLVTSPPGDRRLFVVQRDGRIEIVVDGAVLPAPFLDLDDAVGGPVSREGGEQGLLGLAFHPRFAQNRTFYVYYASPGVNVVAEYRRDPTDPDRGDPTSGRMILVIDDYQTNHNGGMIEFGADELLYISTGDGGGSGDPRQTAGDPTSLLGKMLRIDVDQPGAGLAYGIPPGNPYALGGGRPEILMIGLRNPWRWSFDRATDDIYIGDVGQNAIEEIDVVPLAAAPGTDFGWSQCEGTLDFRGQGCGAPAPPRVRPTFEQLRIGAGGTSNWGAVIGGQVYRGACFPDLVGRYFFADHAVGGLWSFVYTNGQATDVIQHPRTPPEFPSGANAIHADALGELYIAYSSGAIERIVVE